MAKTLKYIGTQDNWAEIAFTGKPSVWKLGQQEERTDAEAKTLLGSGFFVSLAPALSGDQLRSLQTVGDSPLALSLAQGNRILSAMAGGAMVGHRGLGGSATGTPGSPPTPDPMAGSIGTYPENTLSGYLNAYAKGMRMFEIDVWGPLGYLMHDVDPRRVCVPIAWATATTYAAMSYTYTTGGHLWRTKMGGVSGATAPAIPAAYAGATAYSAGQYVTYGGRTWQALQATTGNAPTSAANWRVVENYQASDGAVVWDLIHSVNAWATGTVYAPHSFASNGGNIYWTPNGGTAGATAPTTGGTFTGSIAGTTLTITATLTGALAIGNALYGTAITPGTTVSSGTGPYVVNNSQTVPSTTIYASQSDGGVSWYLVGSLYAMAHNITLLTLPQYRDLTIQAATWMGPGYENEQAPTLRDFLAALSNKAMPIIETKDLNAGFAVANALKEFCIANDMAAVGSFTASWTKPVRDLGYPFIQYAASPGSTSPATVKSNGAVALGTLGVWTAAEVTQYEAAGLLTTPGLAADRLVELADQQSKGCDFYIPDEVLYVNGQGQMNTGVFTDGRWPPGMICEDTPPILSQGGRGIIAPVAAAGAYGWGYNTYTTTPKSTLWGFERLGQTWKRRFWIQYLTSGAVNQGFWFAITDTDAAFKDVNGNYGNGLMGRIRRNGVIDLYVTSQGMTLGAADATATATGLGTDIQTNRCQISIERTPSALIVTNITGGNVAATLNNSTSFGAFLHWGRTQVTGRIDTWERV